MLQKELIADPQSVLRHKPFSRRKFVQGVALGAAVAAIEGHSASAFGASAAGQHTQHNLPELTGNSFDLNLEELPVNFTGKRSRAMAINGSVPGPTLRWREGETVRINVTNRMQVPSSIHWHSVRLPNAMDGVPGITYRGIMPGETFHYEFPVVQNGTAWYHSHTRFQAQLGLSGAIIIEPREGELVKADRDYVIFLADWSDTSPETIFSNLKEDGDYYNYHRRTVPRFFSEAREQGLRRATSSWLSWARMNMSPDDLSDVTGATYTYLLNGNTPATNWTGLFSPGERVRLRFINGSAMTYFDVRIPGLKMTVVSADGNALEPVTVDEFRLGVAERYDVIVEPEAATAYTLFAQSEDRSGYARGTLAPRAGMRAAIPSMDPVPQRTMVDMGMGGASVPGARMPMGINTANMASMVGIDGMTAHDLPAQAQAKEQTMQACKHSMGKGGECCDCKCKSGECCDCKCKGGECCDSKCKGGECCDSKCKGGECCDCKGKSGECCKGKSGECCDCKCKSGECCKCKSGECCKCKGGECCKCKMSHSSCPMAGPMQAEGMHCNPASAALLAILPLGAGKTPFAQPWTNTHPLVDLSPQAFQQAEAALKPADPVHLHIGPEVDEVARHVVNRLNDPGDGLRNNGRRVLTYADLRARFRGTDGRPPTREIELHLTGNMQRYVWGFNGEGFAASEPIRLKLGERVRFVLVNDTMMDHPIHLHGFWSELENGQGEFRPYKDTITIQPAERVSYLVSADTVGRWAYHCHLLYHMEAGMFRIVEVTA